MRYPGISAILKNIQVIAWAAFLVALPVTSFPFFPPAIGGEALVRPLSAYPLIVLVFLAVFPKLLRRPLPKTLLPLLPFVLVALASSLLSLLRGIEPALGVSANARVFRGMFTLAIGCTISLAVALLPDTAEDLKFSLRWIYTGCGLAMLWGSLQAIYIIHFDQQWFNLLLRLQRYISIRPLRVDRISGFTYEPHWFSDQMILLLLPWTLAAVLSGYTVFRWRWRWLTIELLLLGWSICVLPFTFSRTGLINLVVLILLGLVLFGPRLALHDLPFSRLVNKPAFQNFPGLSRLLVTLLAGLVVILPMYFIGTRNSFFARIWSYWGKKDASLTDYLSFLGLDARLIYGETALNTYMAYPLLGVGVGNYAFYFEEMLPYRAIALTPEVLHMVTPEVGQDRLITSKNFYLRLLAETGILGAITFGAFVLAHLGCAIFLRISQEQERKYWGAATLCGLFAFMLSAFTFDSFVFPNMWVVFGLTAAATRVFTHSPQITR